MRELPLIWTPAIASILAIAPCFAVASCFAIASSGVEVSRLLPAVASCFGDLEERTEKEERGVGIKWFDSQN
ncbi:hypothetical protein LXL04_001811 [Taraxacum kok-saghyz]